MSRQHPRSTTDTPRAFASALDVPWRRFIAAAIDHSMRIGLRTPADFLRHFSPADIMESLTDRAEARAQIVEKATGLKRSIGLHKTVASCAADLQIALEQGAIEPIGVIRLLNPDDIAREISGERLWRYVTEDKFWLVDRKTDEFELARAHIAFLLERALSEQLVSHSELVDWLTPDQIAHYIPRKALASLLHGALEVGRAERGFTAAHVLALVPASVLAEHVHLAHIWRSVIVPMMERAHGFGRGDEEPVEATVVTSPERPDPNPLALPPPHEDAGVTELLVEDPHEIYEPSDTVAAITPRRGAAYRTAHTIRRVPRASSPPVHLTDSGTEPQ